MDYNKKADTFNIRHYEDLPNEEILKGIDNIDNNEKDLSHLYEKLNKQKIEIRETEAEIEDLENYQDVINRVTHIYDDVPIIQTEITPDEKTPIGSFQFSQFGDLERIKFVTAKTISKSDSGVYRWDMALNIGNTVNECDLSLPSYFMDIENGFPIGFVKHISHEFVVKDKSIGYLKDNLGDLFSLYLKNKRP